MANSSSQDSSERMKKIAKWARYKVKLATLLSRGDISDVAVLQDYIKKSKHEIDFDATCNQGLTPLMIACQKQQKDIVQYLLCMGTSLNKQAPKTKNTPLHFASEGKKASRWTRNYDNPSDTETRIEILQLLLEHGATLQANSDGLTPPCLAALSGSKDIVEFYASIESIYKMPNMDLVKAFQILGVSLTVFEGEENAEYDLAKECFDRAETLYKESHGEPPPSGASEFEQCFANTGQSEQEDLNEQRLQNERKLFVKGMIIGEKILPDGVERKHFWGKVCWYATSALFEDGYCRMETGFQVFMHFINLEKKSKMKLGTVLSALSQYIVDTASGPVPFPAMVKTGLLVDAFAKMLCRKSNWTVVMESSLIFSALGDLITEVACYHTRAKDLELFLPAAERIAKHVTRAFQILEFPRHRFASLTRYLLEALVVIYMLDYGGSQDKMARKRMMRAIRTLLACDGGLESKSMAFSAGTVLHILMSVSFVAVHAVDFIVQVARLLIRYGCSVSALNCSGNTAKDVLISVFAGVGLNYNQPEYAELLRLLSPPTEPHSLEELASRAVLQNHLPYRDKLPPTLCEVIDGDSVIRDISELDSPKVSRSEGVALSGLQMMVSMRANIFN